MQIVIYSNNSDNRQVHKNITVIKTISAECFEESSILNPVFICAYDVSIFKANYLYVASYGRSYYINDITIIDGHRMQISAHVDVLMTYAAQIQTLSVIIDKQDSLYPDKYYNDESFVVDDKTFNTTIVFPNELLNEGQYVLITAGG